MKYWKYIIWLLILFSCKASAPIANYSMDANFSISFEYDYAPDASYTPVKVKWSCSNERFVSNYKFQRSRNNYNWVTQATYTPKNTPDSSVYSWQLPKSNIAYFYRVTAIMNNGVYYSKILYLKSTAQ